MPGFRAESATATLFFLFGLRTLKLWSYYSYAGARVEEVLTSRGVWTPRPASGANFWGVWTPPGEEFDCDEMAGGGRSERVLLLVPSPKSLRWYQIKPPATHALSQLRFWL